jgi:Flp pilus assembly protein TadB
VKETKMQMGYAGRGATIGGGWGWMIRLAGLFLAGAVLLAVMLVGLFLVLPVMLIGGVALSFYVRRKLRRAQRQQPQGRQPQNGVIDAEYTIIEHR